MTADDHIERLLGALEGAGASVSDRSPRVDDDLAALEGAISPLLLPHDLKRFYERIDPGAFPIHLYPALSNLEEVLSYWRFCAEDDDEPGLVPASLLAFASGDHRLLFVELGGPGLEDGTVFEADYVVEGFQLRLRSFSDWLDTTSEALEQGLFKRRQRPGGEYLHVDRDAWDSLAADRLAARGTHPVYGEWTARYGEDWPEHWHRASALGRGQPPPRTPLTTVAEVLAAGREGERVEATVSGPYMLLAGRGSMTVRLVLWDHTGWIDIACPRSIRGWSRIYYERTGRIEVETTPPGDPEPLPTWLRAKPDESWEHHFGDAVVDLVPPQAIATGFHPHASSSRR